MNIALCGFYGKSNFGDNLMADVLGQALNMDGENKVDVYSDTWDKGVINGLEDDSYLNCDIIVIGGGGIISPKFWIFQKDGIRKLIESKKKIVFLNVNVYKDFEYDPVFVDSLRLLSAKWWVRDKLSKTILERNGIVSQYLPDVSTSNLLPKTDVVKNTNKQMLVFLNSYVTGKIVSDNTSDFIKCHNNLRILASYIDWMINFDWDVVLYPCQICHNIDDRIDAGLLYKIIKNKRKVAWVTNKPTWEETLNEILNSKLIISMRYHPTIIALSNNIATVDITHHEKNGNFITENNLTDLSVNYNLLTKESLIECTKHAESNIFSEPMLAYSKQSTLLWEQFIEEWKDEKRNG